MPKPPRDLSYFDKVNYATSSWVQACDVPWYIYVETLKPAALAAFITLITFGWDDVFRGYYRPKGLGGRRAKKGFGKGKWKPKGFPELGETIGKNIPGATEIKGEKWSSLGKTLWRIDTPIQQALFWWLVVDVTVDFAYTWTSLLNEAIAEDPRTIGCFSKHRIGLQGRLGNRWSKVDCDILDYARSPPSWGVIEGFSGAHAADVGCGVRMSKHPAAPIAGGYQMRLRDITADNIVNETGLMEPDLAGDQDGAIMGAIPPGHVFTFETWADVAIYNIGSGSVTGQAVDPT